jgi:hypothetical protein
MSDRNGRSYFIECSLCKREMRRTILRMSVNSRISGWHRSWKLCGDCTRAHHEWFVARRTSLGL